MPYRGGLFGGIADANRLEESEERRKQSIMRTAQMPQQFADRHAHMLQSMQLQQARLKQIRDMDSMRKQQFAERKKEFDERQKNGGQFGRYMTAEQRNLNAANGILQKYPEAMDKDGNIDVNKISNKWDRFQFNLLAKGAEKGANTSYNMQRLTQSSMIDPTLQKIDPRVLAKYAGINGKKKYTMDLLKSKFESVPDFDSYRTMINTTIPTLAAQLTKYWGTSITPEENKAIQNMAHPKSWKDNPQSTLKSLQTLISIFRGERANTLASLNNADFTTTGQGSDVSSPFGSGQPQQSNAQPQDSSRGLPPITDEYINEAMKAFPNLTKEEIEEKLMKAREKNAT